MTPRSYGELFEALATAGMRAVLRVFQRQLPHQLDAPPAGRMKTSRRNPCGICWRRASSGGAGLLLPGQRRFG